MNSSNLRRFMTAPQCKPNILHPTVIPNWKMLTQQVFSVCKKCWTGGLMSYFLNYDLTASHIILEWKIPFYCLPDVSEII